MPSGEEGKRAGYHDSADYLEKDAAGAYAPGTVVDIGGEKVDLSKVTDHFSGKAKKPKPSKRSSSK